MDKREIVTITPIKFPDICVCCGSHGNVEIYLHGRVERCTNSAVVDLIMPYLASGAIILVGKTIIVRLNIKNILN